VLGDLRARGIESLLCEGGPTLNRALLAAGLVDELFLTLSPVVTGDDTQPAIVMGGALPAPLPLELRSIATADGDLYLRYSV
jgi:riboflavin biosynthesis pyrimidine reductase